MVEISKLMTKDVVTIPSSASIEEAATIMRDENIGALPVTYRDRVVGIVTDRDIVLRSVAEFRTLSTDPVSKIMTRDVRSCLPTDDIETAVALMARCQIRRLPVENRDGTLCGILSLSDLSQQYEDGASFALSEICNPLEMVAASDFIAVESRAGISQAA
ncbi:CBS domain-containing protein [Erythrobacter sp.]|jgi:CBS domain-containing protein|uniref:CBS domain-containing protein n=1 Tax=Erythrobacter sp. TaxID=1042 RepID=UPI002EAB084E|nr:CBS domain-containing protein [Erythrobacter sp.]